MKTILWTLIIVFIVTFTTKAQQVTSVDCCVDVGSKAMIIINDNTTNANNLITPAKPVVVDNNGKCDFKLTISSNTSAGVYNSSDNLIRTLWSGVRYDAGCYNLQWDGLLDDGTQAPVGNYNIKILTNNVKYEWDTFANTTKGHATLKNFGGITSVAAAGNKVFFGHGFYEGESTSRVFSANAIHDVDYVDVGIGVINTGLATDGINNYWLGVDQYQNGGVNGNTTNYFFITKVSDNSEVVSSEATQHPSGRPGNQKMVLGWYSDAANGKSYSGITATKGTGGFIFISRADSNLVYVFSKQSGAVIKKVSINNPSLLAAAGSKIWIQSSVGLLQYNVNSSTGNLTSASVSISGVTPRSLATNSDGSLLKVADGGTSTIKTYNAQTGAFIASFGQSAGYTGNPNITNDRFSFNQPYANPCLTFADDGSYWFNDAGNFRLMHYTSANAYIEQIDYIPSFRSINADPNNPGRVFIEQVEYAIDYSKPLDDGSNGSWRAVKNWGATFGQVITFPNGKTYGTASNGLVWLSDTGKVYVGTTPPFTQLQSDGSIYQRLVQNDAINVYKGTLTGYSNNMPVWSSLAPVVTTPTYSENGPWFPYNLFNVKGSSTNTKRDFFFNPWYGTNGGVKGGYGYHFGGVKIGSNGTWDFLASKSTYFDYHGDYPRNGDYDIGNNDYSLQHSENCQLLVQGSDLFWNVNAEFWQANTGTSGVNIWNHFNEDGLFVANFGVTAPEARNMGEKQMAGNSFSTAIVKVGVDYYIYHCDENRWGAAHRWKVSGLNTIKEVAIPVKVSAPITLLNDPTDLMAGLPFKSTTFTGGFGWTVPPGLNLTTNKLQYSKTNIDIALGGHDSYHIERTLNNTSRLASWKLTAGIGFAYSEISFGNVPDYPENYNYLEILDASGKIIARFIGNQFDTRNNYYGRVWINNVLLAQGSQVKESGNYKDISFDYSNGILKFTHTYYGTTDITTPFEAGADFSKPATLRVNQQGDRFRYINLYKLKFIKGI